MDKETRERKIKEFIEWRKDKKEEEIGLAKYINPENLPDSFFEEPKKEVIQESKQKLVDFRTYKPPKEVLDEYKDLIEELHKWAERSRKYGDK